MSAMVGWLMGFAVPGEGLSPAALEVGESGPEGERRGRLVSQWLPGEEALRRLAGVRRQAAGSANAGGKCRMEILDEYDNECPLIVSFCERITPQDFEGQSMNYTQKALQDLYAQMEQNPSICERVVRKKKQEENENASLGQYLKAKFFTMLQGDVNYANALGEIEMQERVEQLKREMKKANKYARGKPYTFHSSRPETLATISHRGV
ncbi:hypothetical protein JD844_015010 [Phrynosoma platyrhinos]|uniref:Uncharacterized protein n=1 Tax=Phrynosoma platyrhinos TaxID=52577 RepID=A0ABQ7T8A1_PHRPL|nr:hypothetical protein JD844_015010 [Phrynosoma platyrhinos]